MPRVAMAHTTKYRAESQRILQFRVVWEMVKIQQVNKNYGQYDSNWTYSNCPAISLQTWLGTSDACAYEIIDFRQLSAEFHESFCTEDCKHFNRAIYECSFIFIRWLMNELENE